MEVDAFVALGSNLGDRAVLLAGAARSLARHPQIRVAASSRVYETAAVGPGAQGPYLNAVLWLRTGLSPRRLLDEFLGLEARVGRNRDAQERWGPRLLDLDLLLYGDASVDEPGLVVPHPRLHERAFVLEPLCDLVPQRLHPGSQRSFAELADAARGASEVRAWGPSEVRLPLGAG